MSKKFRQNRKFINEGRVGSMQARSFERDDGGAAGRDALSNLLREAQLAPHRLSTALFKQFEDAVTGVLRYAGTISPRRCADRQAGRCRSPQSLTRQPSLERA